MTGTRVVVWLTAIVLGTAVVPPLTASMVNRRRITGAQAAARRLVPRLAAASPGGWLMSQGTQPAFAVAVAAEWYQRQSADRSSLLQTAERADPWGNRYYGFRLSSGIVVICAGPNGIIETPPEATEPAGDDIIARDRQE